MTQGVPPALAREETAAHLPSGLLYGRHPVSGEVVRATPEEFSKFGLLPVEEQVGEKIRGKEILHERIGPTDAAIHGLARGVSGRLSDAAALDDPEQAAYLEAMEHEYPGTMLLGEAIGTLAPLARAAGPLGRMATLPGIAESVAGRVTGGIGNKVLQGLAKGAAEASFYAPGQAISESAISGDPLTVDKIWSAYGPLLLLGGGLGAVQGKLASRARGMEALPQGEKTGADMLAQGTAKWKDGFHPSLKNTIQAAGAKTEPEVIAAIEQSDYFRQLATKEGAEEFRNLTATKLAQGVDDAVQPFEMAYYQNAGRAKIKHVLPNVDIALDDVSQQAVLSTIKDTRERVVALLKKQEALVEDSIIRLPPDQQKIIKAQLGMQEVVEGLQALDNSKPVLEAQAKRKALSAAQDQKSLRGIRQKFGESSLVAQQLEEKIKLELAQEVQLRQRLAELPTQQAKLGTRLKDFERQLDELQAPREIQSMDPALVPPPVRGHVELRRYLGSILEAEKRMLEPAAARQRIATRFIEGDVLKKRAARLAKGGERIGGFDDVAEEMRKIHDDVWRPLLENEQVWGKKLSGLQRSVNAEQHAMLNMSKHINERFMIGTGRASIYDNWLEGKRVDPSKMNAFLDKLDNPLHDADVQMLREYIRSNQRLGKTMEAMYDMTPSERSVLLRGMKNADSMLSTLDDAADKMSFINQARSLSSNLGDLTGFRIVGSMAGASMFGGVGALGGAVAGQGLMHLLNPAARQLAIARIQRIQQSHDNWLIRFVSRLMGGKGQAAPKIKAAGEAVEAAAPAVPKAAEAPKRGRPKKSTPTAALLYSAMKEKGDSDQAAFDRVMARFQATNPKVIEEGLRETAGWMEGASPELWENLKGKTSKIASKIASLAPKPRPPQLFSDQMQGVLGLEAMASIERQIEALVDPKRALENAHDYMLTAEVVDLLDEFHPDLMADIRRVAMEHVESDNPPPHETRVQLSILLRIPADPTMTPEYIGNMQALAEMEEQALMQAASKPSKPGTGRDTGVNISDDTYSFADRLERGIPPR